MGDPVHRCGADDRDVPAAEIHPPGPDGALASCKTLGLAHNRISSAGLKALVSAASAGALSECRHLDLNDNAGIGDEGLEALASALSAGALAEIEYIDLHGCSASQQGRDALRAAADARSIDVIVGDEDAHARRRSVIDDERHHTRVAMPQR